MQTPTLPSHDAARWRLERNGWRVIGQHHAAHPIGLPCRDGYGNYVKTETVWLAPEPLGREAIGTFQAAYATVTSTIHDIALIDAGTAAREILRCVAFYRQYPTREAYVAEMAPHTIGQDPLIVENQWASRADCAIRAERSGILAALA
jgi:hypothetical protein